MNTLCLASTSPYRKVLLERLKLPFFQCRPLIDEDLEKSKWSHLNALELCQKLGFLKGQSVHLARTNPNQITISSDQLVSFQGQILGKTPSVDLAKAQLQSLSGKNHELITSCYVFKDNDVQEILNITRLKMRNLTLEEILAYISIDHPFDCAGTYKIESAGIGLFESIETTDFTAIQGLPLMELCKVLRNWGVTFLSSTTQNPKGSNPS